MDVVPAPERPERLCRHRSLILSLTCSSLGGSTMQALCQRVGRLALPTSTHAAVLGLLPPTVFVKGSALSRDLNSGAIVPHIPLRLNNIAPNEGATRPRKRVGRGKGSGRGKTCGKGHKGSKARGTQKGPGFEGGQTPLIRRIPKRGFKNGPDKSFETVSVERIARFVAMGRLHPKHGLLTMKDLQDAGVVNHIKYGVRLVASSFAPTMQSITDGKVTDTSGDHSENAVEASEASVEVEEDAEGEPGSEEVNRATLPSIHLEVSRASTSAIAAVEAAGGTVTCVHFNTLALRSLLKPEKFVILPRRARPPPRLMPYFLDNGKRGYLSPEVQMRNLKLFGSPTSEVRPDMPKLDA